MNLFDRDVLTTVEVAKICNVASRTVSKWFDAGQLQGYRIPGSKDRRIPVCNLVRFMKNHGIPMDGLMSGHTRVLIVDSDEDVTTTLCDILSTQTTYEIKVVENTFFAGIECERFRPHVLLVDVHLAEGDSETICCAMRDSDDVYAARIIAMSATLTDGQVATLSHSGYDGVLKKPFTVREVIDAIEGAHAVVY